MIVATALGSDSRTLIVIWLAYRFRRLPRSGLRRADQHRHRCLQRRESNRRNVALVAGHGLQRRNRDHCGRRRFARRNRRRSRTRRRGRSTSALAAPGKSRQSARAAACAVGSPHTASLFLSTLTRIFSATRFGCWSNRSPTKGSAQFPVTRKLETCERLSPAARRSNTPAGSISIAAPTLAGIASPLCRERSARFGRARSIKPGGLSLQTLAEDTDLTLALHKDRQRIVYVPEAIAWTEAPETVRTLARQRFRWAYGTLQCLWKHRDMVFNWNYRALGWFSLPSVWFFQIILVAVTPMVDLFLLASLPFGAWRAVSAVRHHISVNGCDSGHARLHPGTRTDQARVANFADAPDLSADAELLHLESNSARDQRRLGELGQTRTHRERAGSRIARTDSKFEYRNSRQVRMFKARKS